MLYCNCDKQTEQEGLFSWNFSSLSTFISGPWILWLSKHRIIFNFLSLQFIKRERFKLFSMSCASCGKSKTVTAPWKCDHQFSKSTVSLHPPSVLILLFKQTISMCASHSGALDGRHLRYTAFSHSSSSSFLVVNLSLFLCSLLFILISFFLSLIHHPYLWFCCDLQFYLGNIFFLSPL